MSKNPNSIDNLAQLNVQALGSLFPYRIYDENRAVYINKKSVMKIAEFPLLSGANEKLIKDLVSCINNNISTDVFVRIFRLTHQKVDARFSKISDELQLDGFSALSELSKKQMDFYKYSAVHSFKNKCGLDTTLLDSRVFFEISIESNHSNQDEKIDLLNMLFDKIKVELNTANIPATLVDAQTFLALLRVYLQFDRDDLSFNYDYDHVQYLNDQLTKMGCETDIERDGVVFSTKNKKHKCSTYTLSKLPKSFALYNTADFLAHIDKNASLTCPHIFSIAFQLIADDKAKSKARSKYFSLEKQAHSMMVRLFPKLKDQFNEWSKIRNDLERDEIRLCDTYAAITLFSDLEHHNKHRSQFESVMKSCSYGGFEVESPNDIQLPLLLSNFPGMICEGMWVDLKRASLVKQRTTWNLVNLLPMLGDWKGSYTGFIAPGQRNQLSCIDIFSDQVPTDNNNVAIAAGSGAGKSVLTQTMMYHVLATGGVVFIIDKGESYKKLCQILGGVYIDGKNLKLNPFTHLEKIKDPDSFKLYFSMIRDLLATIASPAGDLDQVSKAHLLEAAFVAYEKYKSKTNIDCVVEILTSIDEKHKNETGKSDQRIHDLTTLLREYTTTGINGKYFNEASLIDPNAKLIVLELGSIDANEDLLKAVLFSLINNISQRMYLSDRSQKKICIIDEAWALLTGDNKLASKFIEKGYRTSRKHGGSFVTVTQGVTDYFKDECALACWNNADIKIIMRQNDGALKKFTEDHPTIFSPYEQHVLSQFRSAKDAGFSSLMLKAGSLTTFHRLFLDPHTRILFSTDPHEFQMVFDLVQKNASLSKAIDMTARHFYFDEIADIENYFNRIVASTTSGHVAAV